MRTSNAGLYAQPESSLAAAWGRAFLAMLDTPGREIAPFVVSVAAGPDGTLTEDDDLRDALDACLAEDRHPSVETVANTIFPLSLWRRAGGKRAALYDHYRTNLPDYVAMEPNKNCHGVYFARLIGYGVDPRTGEPADHLPAAALKEGGNQLEYLIKTCKPGAQRMALQAAIYDPVRDQTAARRGFPCLQHLTLVPDFHEKTLALNAFYATQQLYVKAYGNWLGLGRLGAFVAGETGLRLARMTCFAGVQKMSGDMRPGPGPLLDRLKDHARAAAQAGAAVAATAGASRA